MSPWVGLVLAYVVGATPTSAWVARAFYGLDLREHGSGNLGATNTFRVLGPRAAAPVMLVDVLKGWVPARLFPAWFGVAGTGWVMAFAAAAVLGHVFSFWVKFRGGKGIATSAGAFAALAPLATAVALGTWLLVLAAGRRVSLASLAAAVALPVTIAVAGGATSGTGLLVFSGTVAAFVFWTHRSNIGRLLRNEEPRIGSSGRGPRGERETTAGTPEATSREGQPGA